MNKELEKWISDKADEFYGNETHILPQKIAFSVGARSMYKNIEERNRSENVAAFLLGMDSTKNQPPTKEQLAKAMKIAEREFNTIRYSEDVCDYILKHWHDDTIKRIEEIEKQMDNDCHR